MVSNLDDYKAETMENRSLQFLCIKVPIFWWIALRNFFLKATLIFLNMKKEKSAEKTSIQTSLPSKWWNLLLHEICMLYLN